MKIPGKTRLLAVGLLVVMSIATGMTAKSFWTYYQSRNTEILERRRALGRLEFLISQKAVLDRLAALRRSDQPNILLFDASSPTLMAAQLQQRLQHVVATSQAQFIRASEIPQREQDGLIFAGLRLEVTGSVESLAKIVASIEASVPLLFIERAAFAGDHLAGTLPTRMPMLALSLDVVGALRPIKQQETKGSVH